MAAPGRPLPAGVDGRVPADLRRDLPARHGVVHAALRRPGPDPRRGLRPRTSLHHTGAVGRSARPAANTTTHPRLDPVPAAPGVPSAHPGGRPRPRGTTVA